MVKNRGVTVFLMLVVGWLGLSSLLPAISLAAAATQATVVDSQHLKYDNDGTGEKTYTKGKGAATGDDENSYLKSGDPHVCAKSTSSAKLMADDTKGIQKYVDQYDAVIRNVDFDGKKADYIVYQYQLYQKNPSGIGSDTRITQDDIGNNPNQKFGIGSNFYAVCAEMKKTGITLKATINDSDFRWVDAGYIQWVTQKKNYFSENGAKNYTWTADPGDCKELINVDKIGSTSGTLFHSGPTQNVNGSCPLDKYEQRSITIADPVVDGKKSSSLPAGSGENSEGKTSKEAQEAEEQEKEDNSCEAHGGPLGWILCKVLETMDDVVQKLDESIQNLLSVPDSYVNNSDIALVASRMRNLAYIVLVPIMLVMVIGTALGYEVISSYTVKKAMPRLVMAVLFMALAFPLCKFLVTLTNDVGGGIQGLILSQVKNADKVSLATIFHPDKASFGVALGGGVTAAAIGLAAGSIGILFSYMFVAFLGIIIGFLLLSFRQFLIIALLLLAPLAILSWIFPNHDKLWKLWWGTFSKLLLLFPLIMVLIASGKAFAAIVQAGSTSGTVATLIEIVAYVGPYFLIPTTFKFAGGVFGSVAGIANDRGKGIFDRQKKYRKEQMGQNYEHRVGRRVLAKRADLQNRLQGSNSRLVRAGSRMVGGYNIQAAASAKQAAVGKELNDQIATGRDEEIRGLTVNKKAAAAEAATARWDRSLNGGAGGWTKNVNDKSILRRIGKDGGVEYKSLGGAWVTEGAVNAGQSRWGKDVFAQQTALSYEMRKAMTGDQVEGISERYADLATQQWGLKENQAQGAWIGAGFENQNQHIEFKNTTWQGELEGTKLANEIYEKKGSYPLSQMSAHSITALRKAHSKAVRTGDFQTADKVKLIAEQFMARGGGAAGGVAALDDKGNVIPATPAAGGATTGVVMTNTPGAAHVAEEVRKLAVQTGVYQQLDPSTDTRPLGGPPNIPRLN